MLPVLPKKPKAGLDASAYRGRDVATGSFSFGPEADLATVAEIVSAFVRAFVPPNGLRVRVSRATRTEVLPTNFSPSASVSAAQLGRGGSVELSAGSAFEKAVGGGPIFWIESIPDEALHFGFTMVRPTSARPEGAIAHAMSTLAETVVEVPGCVSAIVVAQSTMTSREATALPYEVLAGRKAMARDIDWMRTHVRSPGWRVLVPRTEARRLSRPPPGGVTLHRANAGVLVAVDTPTPFAVTSTESLERWLLPLL